MMMDAELVANREFQSANLIPVGGAGWCVHFSSCLLDQEADIGEQVAPILHRLFSQHYTSCQVTMKKWPGANHEFNIQISVYA